MENSSTQAALPSMAALANIDLERFRLINSILMALLASDVAESTFAQIIHGLPTRGSFEHNTAMRTSNFEIASRDEPTRQSRFIFREFRDQLQPAFMTLDPKVGSPGLSEYPHPVRTTSTPTGISDVVGYWAETQIFGGVVLFEHEQPQAHSKILNAFIHPQSHEAFQVSSHQIQQLLNIDQLASSSTQEAPFFPFNPSPNTRMVGCNKFQVANIFRDEFSKIYAMRTLERPTCVVPMTSEMRNMIKWVNTELAHTPCAGEPGDDSHSIAKEDRSNEV